MFLGSRRCLDTSALQPVIQPGAACTVTVDNEALGSTMGMSDKDRALLPRPLLRTHRAPFSAIGSSISKALLDRETRMSVTAHTSRYTCRAITRCGNGVGAPANDTTALRTVAAICLPTLDGLPPFLVTRHPLEVCLLSHEAKFEPLSPPLQCSLRFFQHPLPAISLVGLATILPIGKISSLPRSA